MSQHDYVLADAAGAAFLADLNSNLAAIVSQNSGATAPSTTYAYQWWADTTTGILKQRNAANSAWISVLTMSTGAPTAVPSSVITGTTTNDSAAAGKVGEYTSSTVLVGSAVSLTTGTGKTVTSISLTAGDWDVVGAAMFNFAGAPTSAYASINTVNNTLATEYAGIAATLSVTSQPVIPPTTRISIASTTTVYLTVYAAFASTATAHGRISARRVR